MSDYSSSSSSFDDDELTSFPSMEEIAAKVFRDNLSDDVGQLLDFDDCLILQIILDQMIHWPSQCINENRKVLTDCESLFLAEFVAELQDYVFNNPYLDESNFEIIWFILQLCASRADKYGAEKICTDSTQLAQMVRTNHLCDLVSDSMSLAVNVFFNPAYPQIFIDDVRFITKPSTTDQSMVVLYNWISLSARREWSIGNMTQAWTNRSILDLFEQLCVDEDRFAVHNLTDITDTCPIHMRDLVEDIHTRKGSLRKVRLCKLLAARHEATADTRSEKSLVFISAHPGLENSIGILTSAARRFPNSPNELGSVMRDLFVERALALMPSGMPWLVVYEILCRIMPTIFHSVREFACREIVRVVHQATRKALLARELN